MKTFKGFDKNMMCRGFQYNEGKEYKEERAIACETGFHACEYPLDCFSYYSPNTSTYHEVEQDGEIGRHIVDTKIASTKIKIGAEINIAGLVKAAIEYTVKRVKPEARSNENYGASSAGDAENVAVSWGYKGRAKGVIGSYLVLADWEGNENEYWKQDNWTLKGAKMVRVDGETIKADTYYTMIEGEIVEVE